MVHGTDSPSSEKNENPDSLFRKRVLLVEDSHTQAILLQHVLEEVDLHVSVVASAEEAFQHIEKNPPDVILSDLYLPGMRGDEFCRQLRMNFETREIPILILTAENSQAIELQSLDSGADDFVAKSIDSEILQSRVCSLLTKSKEDRIETNVQLGEKTFQQATILTIDDSATYQQFLKEQLCSEGYLIEQAENGEEGIAKLEVIDYDCVVVDLVMPGMDGIAVCEEINRIRNERNIPIVALMLTAHENKEDLTRALASGADDFVGKNSDIAVLKGRIRALLRRKFFQEENSRILEELKNKELEAVRARAEKKVAEARASVVEELRAARDAAEKASITKSDFLANMSHEIRTPLNGVIGMTEILLKSPLSDQQQNYAKLAKHSADSLLELLNDILDFSKIEAGKLDLDPHEFLIREDFGDTLQMMAIRASEKNLELTFRIPPDIPERMVGDLARIRQVLINLVGNAIKFTSEGEVAVGVDIESKSKSDAVLHFYVRDTGTGIPEQHIEDIFAAFTQADTSTTRRFGGTGLGLAISRQLVELMEGRIWVESEVDQGSTFHFTVRLDLCDSSSSVDFFTNTERVFSEVIVVDDHQTSREILVEIVESWGFVAIPFERGEDAIDYLKNPEDRETRTHPQLAIIDLKLPGMDGDDLGKQISQLPHAVECILLHAASRQPSTNEIDEINPRCCLLKPVKHSKLAEAMGSKVDTANPSVKKAEEKQLCIPPLRILLAEDGRINQVVAEEILADLGHTVSIVENGCLAVDFVKDQRDNIDLVLMDVQMPELNGLEATELIRKAENGKRMPIIAMTANAMVGDREKCLKAGMDDYIAKPIRPEELDRVIAKVIESIAPDKLEQASNAFRLDCAQLQDRYRNKPEVLHKLIRYFLEDSKALLRKLEAAVSEHDQKAVSELAHSIKGLIGNYPAPEAYECTCDFFEATQHDDWASIVAIHPLIENAVNAVANDMGGILIAK